MEKIYDLIKSDIYLDICIFVGLLIVITILIIMISNNRKRQKIKKDFEIAEHVEKELEKIEEAPVNSELENILQKMQDDMELKPEDVVKKFEEEQEQNAIISYQELVNNVKSGKIEVIEDEASNVNFVEDLGVEPVDQPIAETIEESVIEQVNETEEKVTPVMVKDAIENITLNSVKEEPKKFKQSEFISPIYGIMENNTQYPTVKKETMLDIMNTRDYNELTEEIRRQEEFLNTLKEFRNNL